MERPLQFFGFSNMCPVLVSESVRLSRSVAVFPQILRRSIWVPTAHPLANRNVGRARKGSRSGLPHRGLLAYHYPVSTCVSQPRYSS
jgi:hypothetical protein